MKITCIRIGKERIKPAQVDLEAIELLLRMRFARAGFITDVFPMSSTSIKVGLRQRSFKLDLTRHDRNLRHNPHMASTLTDTPTWEQRVQFNTIVNSVLNKLKISANVKSGPFTIRKGREVFTEGDWYDQKPEYLQSNESRGFYIEECDEKEYLEERRIERNKAAKEKRALKKQQTHSGTVQERGLQMVRS